MKNLRVGIRRFWNLKPMFFTSVITILVLVILTGFIHEFGHIIVCVNDGHGFTLKFENLALQTDCLEEPDNVLLYWALGGIFGIVSSVWLLLFRKFRTNKGMFIGVVVVAFDHFLKLIFETHPNTHDVYLHSFVFKMYLGGMVAFLWLWLLWFFRQRTKKET